MDVVPESDGADTRTRQGIAGSVALIATYGPTTSGNGWFTACSGTLITRDRVLTSLECLGRRNENNDLIVKPLIHIRVALSHADFLAGISFAVEAVLPWAPEGAAGAQVAVLDLVTPVPPSKVQRIAPVFTGDLTSLLGRRPALVAGFGSTCSGCFNNERRIGLVGSAVVVDDEQSPTGHPRLKAVLDEVLDAIPYWDDGGGPLFLYDRASKRYVLAGVSLRFFENVGSDPESNLRTWVYTGHLGDGVASHDHAATLLPLLGVDADRDNDRVPDDGDNCSPAVCTQYGLPITECTNRDQMDTDGDLLGNACCFADPRAVVQNTNVEAEDSAGATARPDACDPVPLLRLSSWKPPYANIPGLEREVLYFRGSTWVGDGAEPEQFDEEIAFRYCGCYDRFDNPMPEADCKEEEVCIASEAVEGFGGFTPVGVSWKVNTWQSVPVPPEGGLPQPFEEEHSRSSRGYAWAWHADALAETIRNVPSASAGQRETQGFFASAVKNNDVYYSGRDFNAAGKLRADLEFRELPPDTPADLDKFVPPYLVSSNCVANPFGCYTPFLMPWELWIEQLAGGRDLVREPLHVQLDPASRKPFASVYWDAAYRFDFGASVADLTAWTYPDASAPWPFVSPVEPLAFLHQHGITSRGVRVAPPNVAAHTAFVAYSDATGLHLAGVEGESDLQAASVSLLLGDEPEETLVRIPAGGRALYSASREALYLVGGSAVSPASRVRRYDTRAQQLEVLPVDPAFVPSGQVLGAAFDSLRDVLYVLDVENGKSRLFAHDLSTGNARQLWIASYAGVYSSVFLGQAEDGQLLLVVSGPSSYTVWSIAPFGEEAVFTGRVDGAGAPIAIPVMGPYSAVMAVLEAGGIRSVELSPSAFEEGPPCEGL